MVGHRKDTQCTGSPLQQRTESGRSQILRRQEQVENELRNLDATMVSVQF